MIHILRLLLLWLTLLLLQLQLLIIVDLIMVNEQLRSVRISKFSGCHSEYLEKANRKRSPISRKTKGELIKTSEKTKERDRLAQSTVT